MQAVDPLLPSQARRPAALIAACCIATALLLGILTAHSSRPDPVDSTVDAWIQRAVGAHRAGLRLLEDIAEPTQVALLALVVALACLVARRVNGALLAVLSVLTSVALTELVLKPIFGRTLHGALVYPSGHAGRAFTLAAVVVVLLLNPPGHRLNRALKAVIGVAAVLISSAVAVAMIGLDYHYFTDTIGAGVLAIGVVLTASLLLDTERVRRPLHVTRPVPDGASRAACPGTDAPSRSFRRPDRQDLPRT